MRILLFPISRITFCFVLGIATAFYAQLSPKIVWAALFLSFLICLLFYFKSQKEFRNSICFGIAVCCLSFSSGIITQISHTDIYQKNHYVHQIQNPEEIHLWEVVLKEKIKTTTKNLRYIAKVEKIDGKNCTGQVLLNIKIPDQKFLLSIGNRLLVSETAAPAKNYNPGGFNYRAYLERKNIYALIFTNPDKIKTLILPEKGIRYYASQIRERCIKTLEKKKFDDKELQLVNALLLGQQQDISPEILQDYQLAGAVHILSVSGLHVGFIMLFLEFSLKRLPKNRLRNIFRFVVITLGLWAFAIIAGLSPSVVRSTVMFTFLAVGNLLKRETNIFHTLLVSILLILIFEPGFLFDVGFQLSYSALFFIIWLQPWIVGLWSPTNKILNYFWQILAVSFAAQIGTLPLSLYYFHQFPGLFWLTNLIVLPAVAIIMGLGAVVLLFAVFRFVPDFLVWPLEKGIHWLNQVIHYIASLEDFIIRDVPLNFQVLIMAYVIVFSLFIWLQKPNYSRLMITGAFVIVIQGIFAFAQYREQAADKLLVLHFSKKTLIAEQKGNNLMLFSNQNDSLSQQENLWLKNYRTEHFNPKIENQKLKNFYYFKQKKILVIDSSKVCLHNCNPHLLILVQSPKINLDRILQSISPKKVIADGSNSKRLISLWKTTCVKRKIPFHATVEKGFYEIE